MIKYFLLISLLAWAQAVDDDSHAHIEKEFAQNDGHGHFSFGYDITNGIGADEEGDEKAVHGEFHFTTKEGHSIKISYIADASGFHPESDILPTPPTTPEAILKALEYIKSHPNSEYRNSDKKNN